MRRDLADLAERAGKAGRVALTRTAIDIRAAVVREMRTVFDRPTAYTLGSVYYRPATGGNTDARGRAWPAGEAVVWLKDELSSGKGTPATRYLAPQIEGGHRRDKRAESRLRAIGLLPPGMQAVPGPAARLDADGNMHRGEITAILSYFRAFNDAGYSANRAAHRRGRYRRHDWIHIPPGDPLPPGIYLSDTRSGRARRGSSLVPVLRFVAAPVYRRRLDFHGIAARVVAEALPRHLARVVR